MAALHSYAILDAPDDGAFDDFVQIAAEVCEAPIAIVNLVDAARQWFAAEIGLGIRETSLDVSICAHAILQPGLFIVPDLTQDHRFGSNPLITGHPGLRFYAGALLQTASGLPLGTLCVLDTKPRPDGVTPRQASTLRALARQVMTQLELRRTLREQDLLVQEVHHRVKNSLAMVQSLLQLQARASAHPEAAQQLRESAGRVRTFGAMHENLYRFGGVAEVDLAIYLRSLLDDEQAGLASTLHDREIAFHAETTQWPAAESPQLGLVMLELVTNALKYGQGRITVSLAAEPSHINLAVEDEGSGLPLGFDPANSTGLGMRLVTGLLQGRGGALTIDRSHPGARFVASLPRPASPQAGDQR